MGKSIRKTLTLFNKCKSVLNYELIAEEVVTAHEQKGTVEMGRQTHGETKGLTFPHSTHACNADSINDGELAGL